MLLLCILHCVCLMFCVFVSCCFYCVLNVWRVHGRHYAPATVNLSEGEFFTGVGNIWDTLAGSAAEPAAAACINFTVGELSTCMGRNICEPSAETTDKRTDKQIDIASRNGPPVKRRGLSKHIVTLHRVRHSHV